MKYTTLKGKAATCQFVQACVWKLTFLKQHSFDSGFGKDSIIAHDLQEYRFVPVSLQP